MDKEDSKQTQNTFSWYRSYYRFHIKKLISMSKDDCISIYLALIW